MIDFEKKGFFNIHTLLTKDFANLSNNNNKHIYWKRMIGNVSDIWNKNNIKQDTGMGQK